ncbi:MAG: RecQ family ATP-dependent DNA helicase [Gammaproteobacteria bacterium]|nr:RecQ family ATP-dependent DNA helicase [Gammaproteobacteria bacterium]
MRCISVDLEVNKRNERIFALAAVDEASGDTLILPKERLRSLGLKAALAQLDEFVPENASLVGHNLIAFDMAHLRAAAPGLRLHGLPMLDTLRLSPLAFPANPYHRLVKHYQDGGLIRGQINDPELDARLTLMLLADERTALAKADADLLLAWHWLCGASPGNGGFDAFFAEVRGTAKPTTVQAEAAIRRRLEGQACATQVNNLLMANALDGWPLAYALAWLSVAGGNSVMPPWVRHQFPAAGRLVRALRDTACADPICAWCRDRHDPAKELKRWFGFADFRADPSTPSGQSMQQAIVQRAMAGDPVLAILPTGAGKSLCYQVPALSRYDKTGALTVVISPLVALMADQVAGLEARGISNGVTVNGMLSMPERSDALDRVRLGDAAILITSPEQLRNRSLRRALEQREVGAWVLDEAHCLSSWGHDFRPDYRYVGRFIRERTGTQNHTQADQASPPVVMCLTATAKPEVVTDIQDYFHDTLGIQFTVFNGGSRRENLEFEVRPTDAAHKLDDIHQALEADLPADLPGGAIVYCATRRHCEEVAEHLRRKGIASAHFHSLLSPETKQHTQRQFIEGQLRVIAATNAFGMGIDKPDVRLVIHADIPGSLENYLQEAGRAGRDRQYARCLLLYTTDDLERQFGMSARSRLTRREIHGILKALRQVDRKGQLRGEVVATAGEILAEDEDSEFERDSATDDTRVKAAVAWLEEAALLRRDENRVQVFPSSLRVQSVDEAHRRLATNQGLTDSRRQTLLRLVQALIAADPDEGVSTDELMGVARLSAPGVRRALHDLEHLGLVTNDMALTAFVHVGITRSSDKRLQDAQVLEVALVDLMREAAPDLAKGESHNLHLRVAAQKLKDDGLIHALPDRLIRILRSIEQDGRGEDRAADGAGGSIKLRRPNREQANLTLLRGWRNLAEMAQRRRHAGKLLLDHLLGTLPQGARGTDLLAETTFGKLRQALADDLLLRSASPDLGKLLDRALLWLHEQEVIRLNKGFTVFRPAMTIHLEEQSDSGGRRRGFGAADFEPLKLHYQEQVLQIHVMAEFAAQGLEATADALRLAMDYFSLDRQTFLDRWLPNREAELARETTPATWQTIVGGLSADQRRIVADDREQANMLVLAGPGSGKTRVLVHRIAYLLRVRRQPSRGILALAYNRHAAVEIRRRLEELVGQDAKGVTVLTCHAMAMRLVGASFADMRRSDNEDPQQAFAEVLREATALLKGEDLLPEEADTQRDRLLAGFRHILVDEYQDLDQDQYELISAMAGRSRDDEDSKLTLFAVGDDDQNVYSFMGASGAFIRRFTEDYAAKPVWLTQNYRSSAHIIDAANAFIEPARQRMKGDHPIEVDRARRKAPPGGEWTERDPVGRGRVQILRAGTDEKTQALAALAEFQRLAALSAEDWDWRRCAMIARRWQTLESVQSLCEVEGVPAQMATDDASYFWRLRETRELRHWLDQRPNPFLTAETLESWANHQPVSGWMNALREAIAEFRLEYGDAETSVESFNEWLAEWGQAFRRRQQGVLLVTAHSAKGLEFDHVIILDDDWQVTGRNEDPDAWRRLYYVAMTRAKKTLALASITGPGHPPAVGTEPASGPGTLQVRDQRVTRWNRQGPIRELRGHACVLHRPPTNLPPAPPELDHRRTALTLKDVNLGFPGRRPAADPIHAAIRRLKPSDPLYLRTDQGPWELTTREGQVVTRLARSYLPTGQFHSARVHAIVGWQQDDSEPEYQQGLRCDEWEVVVPELVLS